MGLRTKEEMFKDLKPKIKSKAESLLNWFREREKVVVALSGGVDSSVIAAFAYLALNDNAVAVTGVSPTLAKSELEDAKIIASRIGIQHIILDYDKLANHQVGKNEENRCYYCRNELGRLMRSIAYKMEVKTLVDGGIFEDISMRRPGVKAFRENGVVSPLQEIGITKDDVRELAQSVGLPNFNKPSNACLASRFPYGQTITRQALTRVDEAEMMIKKITGARQIRVRIHIDIARIEVAPLERKMFFKDSVMDLINEKMRKIGFQYVTLDLAGYRTGSLDEALKYDI